MTRATSVEDYKLRGSFEAVRRTLLAPERADRLDKPLAYWALPNDRRLPLAFLGRSIRELLDTPFEALCGTPGVGHKKIQSLIKLLHRAAKEGHSTTSSSRRKEPAPVWRIDAPETPEFTEPESGEAGEFDADRVSEALWGRWRETVVRHRLEGQLLGRLAPSLQNLPTVIWRTPLKFYADRTLQEIRSLKTHGEKRVRVVLEVFHAAHRILSEAEADDRLAVRLMPRFAAQVENWIDRVLADEQSPDAGGIESFVAGPLVEQVRIDAGSPVHELAEGRLGIGDAPQSVRLQSRRLGVTRARVYQLLDECGVIMAVRWPEGRTKLRYFQDWLDSRSTPDAARLCRGVREVFFPDKSHALHNEEEE
jgi:hypothetical protein